MSSTQFSLAGHLGMWLDRMGSRVQPPSGKRSGRPFAVMGHLVFTDDHLPSVVPARSR